MRSYVQTAEHPRISKGKGAQRMVRGYGYGQVMVCCGGGVGWVRCGRGCAKVGAWVWLRAGDGALRLGFKCVSADAHIR